MVQFDPQLIPLDPAFGAHERGAPVPLEHLAPAALRRRFTAPPVWTPELHADARLLRPEQEVRPAAVLVPVVAHAGAPTVLFTERTSHLHDHAGQISFPGGRMDEGDADAVATALRETAEEIGLAARHIEVIGHLPPYLTASSYQVTPVVALVQPGFSLKLDAFEVAEAFEVPLAFLMDPRHHQRHLVQFAGQARTYYAMPWQAQRRYFIWGATAAMLRNLYRFLAA
jgi:8-oxo-dGTP pyrophosphatase MutT (NUDIX family)